jgi:hypothetical protein
MADRTMNFGFCGIICRSNGKKFRMPIVPPSANLRELPLCYYPHTSFFEQLDLSRHRRNQIVHGFVGEAVV